MTTPLYFQIRPYPFFAFDIPRLRHSPLSALAILIRKVEVDFFERFPSGFRVEGPDNGRVEAIQSCKDDVIPVVDLLDRDRRHLNEHELEEPVEHISQG